MASEEHLEMLKKGVKAWNAWREHDYQVNYWEPELCSIKPDLSDAKLGSRNLQRIDLYLANLCRADFQNAILHDASFIKADLRQANLGEINLVGAKFEKADLRGANLVGAQLRGVDFSWAQLNDANLSQAWLFGCDLIGASLEGTDLSNALISNVTFGDNDLSGVKGLETIQHSSPSTIGIDTFYRSDGRIPLDFLRGTGVPEEFITYLLTLKDKPIRFYSCFISFASNDEAFAQRLYADIQNHGVRCWFAPEDLKIGTKIRIGLDESIRKHEKLLLVLSQASIKSQWVEQEVETALKREREQDRPVLFPVRLDNSVMEINSGWPAFIRHTRHIGDFTLWNDRDAYRKALARLLRDLQIGDAEEDRA